MDLLIACTHIVVIGMLCFICISQNRNYISILWEHLLVIFYLIIYYVLSLARHQDKYYLNYICNLKHNRFVIV
jgi:hypothetical protein